MNIRAEINFYLPFRLPRTKAWDLLAIKTEYKRYAAEIHPANQKTGLYPKGIGEPIKNTVFNIDHCGWPEFHASIRATNYIHDRLLIILKRNINSKIILNEKLFTNSFLPAAIKVANHFFELLMVASKESNLRKVGQIFNIKVLKTFIIWSWTASMFKEEDNRISPLPIFNGVNTVSKIIGFESPITGIVELDDIKKIGNLSTQDYLHWKFYCEAIRYLKEVDLYGFILSAATAMEVIVGKMHAINSSLAKAIDEKKISFASKWFDEYPKQVFNEGLMRKSRKDYDNCDIIYKARNKMIHEGELYYLFNGYKKKINIKKAYELSLSLKTTLEWLEDKFKNYNLI